MPRVNGTAAGLPRDPAGALSARAWLGVVLLALIGALNFLDRITVSVLGVPIRQEFALSGTAFGLLSGFAFALLYALAAPPAARLGDRLGHARVLGAAVALWSLATIAGGLAGSFAMLLATRMALALGEAAVSSTSAGIVGSLVPPARWTAANAIVNLGFPLGALAGAPLVGAIAAHGGWREAFLVTGALGFPLAAAIALLGSGGSAPRPRSSFPAVAGALARDRAIRRLALGYLLLPMTGVVLVQWLPQALAAIHGTPVAETAGLFGLALGLGTLAGALPLPLLVAAWARGDADREMRATALLLPAQSLLALAGLAAPSAALSIMLFGATFACAAAVLPPLTSAIQRAAPADSRALACAIIVLPGNLVGAGLGPLLVGVLADRLPVIAQLPPLVSALAIISTFGSLAMIPLWPKRRRGR